MKSLEILSALPKWAHAGHSQIVDSPAFSMPCRLGEETVHLRTGAVESADTLDLSILFGDELHALKLARSPRFAELGKIWDARADVPEPILLALVERDCGPFFQLLENAVRRQLKVAALSPSSGGAEPGPVMSFQVADISFSLTCSAAVSNAFGSLRHLDLAHPSLRAETLAAEVEYAAFMLSATDLAAMSAGDALLLPEIGTVPPRLVADGRFVLDANGVAPFAEDERCRVVSADPRSITLGELFDAAEDAPSSAVGEADYSKACGHLQQLRLVHNGATVASGRLDRLGDQPAFIVETTNHPTT